MRRGEDAMITFYTIPRAFEGEFDELQRVAIRSWRQVVPGCQVILMGDEEGVAGVAEDWGLNHWAELPRNEHGTPLVNGAFWLAEGLARHDLLCEISADICLSDDFAAALRIIGATGQPFVIGQRWDVGADGSKTLHPPCGIDYFIYRRGTIGEIPAFAVGRTAYDNWLVWAAMERWGLDVIDATADITALHLAHSARQDRGAAEVRENERLFEASGCPRRAGVNDASWVLRGGRILRRDCLRVLVTGAQGWIGTAACEELERRGHDVVTYDLKDGQDIHDADALREALDGCDAVVHLAAIPHPHPKRRWEAYWRANVAGTQAVAAAAAEFGALQFVYSSSTAYYGAQRGWLQGPQPLVEDGPNGIQRNLHAERPELTDYNCAALAYVCSKIAAEAVLAAYGMAGRLGVSVLRFAPSPADGQPWEWGLLCERERAARAIADAVGAAPGNGYWITNVASPHVELVDTARYERGIGV